MSKSAQGKSSASNKKSITKNTKVTKIESQATIAKEYIENLVSGSKDLKDFLKIVSGYSLGFGIMNIVNPNDDGTGPLLKVQDQSWNVREPTKHDLAAMHKDMGLGSKLRPLQFEFFVTVAVKRTAIDIGSLSTSIQERDHKRVRWNEGFAGADNTAYLGDGRHRQAYLQNYILAKQLAVIARSEQELEALTNKNVSNPDARRALQKLIDEAQEVIDQRGLWLVQFFDLDLIDDHKDSKAIKHYMSSNQKIWRVNETDQSSIRLMFNAVHNMPLVEARKHILFHVKSVFDPANRRLIGIGRYPEWFYIMARLHKFLLYRVQQPFTITTMYNWRYGAMQYVQPYIAMGTACLQVLCSDYQLPPYSTDEGVRSQQAAKLYNYQKTFRTTDDVDFDFIDDAGYRILQHCYATILGSSISSWGLQENQQPITSYSILYEKYAVQIQQELNQWVDARLDSSFNNGEYNTAERIALLKSFSNKVRWLIDGQIFINGQITPELCTKTPLICPGFALDLGGEMRRLQWSAIQVATWYEPTILAELKSRANEESMPFTSALQYSAIERGHTDTEALCFVTEFLKATLETRHTLLTELSLGTPLLKTPEFIKSDYVVPFPALQSHPNDSYSKMQLLMKTIREAYFVTSWNTEDKNPWEEIDINTSMPNKDLKNSSYHGRIINMLNCTWKPWHTRPAEAEKQQDYNLQSTFIREIFRTLLLYNEQKQRGIFQNWAGWEAITALEKKTDMCPWFKWKQPNHRADAKNMMVEYSLANTASNREIAAGKLLHTIYKTLVQKPIAIPGPDEKGGMVHKASKAICDAFEAIVQETILNLAKESRAELNQETHFMEPFPQTYLDQIRINLNLPVLQMASYDELSLFFTPKTDKEREDLIGSGMKSGGQEYQELMLKQEAKSAAAQERLNRIQNLRRPVKALVKTIISKGKGKEKAATEESLSSAAKEKAKEKTATEGNESSADEDVIQPPPKQMKRKAATRPAANNPKDSTVASPPQKKRKTKSQPKAKTQKSPAYIDTEPSDEENNIAVDLVNVLNSSLEPETTDTRGEGTQQSEEEETDNTDPSKAGPSTSKKLITQKEMRIILSTQGHTKAQKKDIHSKYQVGGKTLDKSSTLAQEQASTEKHMESLSIAPLDTGSDNTDMDVSDNGSQKVLVPSTSDIEHFPSTQPFPSTQIPREDDQMEVSDSQSMSQVQPAKLTQALNNDSGSDP